MNARTELQHCGLHLLLLRLQAHVLLLQCRFLLLYARLGEDKPLVSGQRRRQRRTDLDLPRLALLVVLELVHVLLKLLDLRLRHHLLLLRGLHGRFRLSNRLPELFDLRANLIRTLGGAFPLQRKSQCKEIEEARTRAALLLPTCSPNRRNSCSLICSSRVRALHASLPGRAAASSRSSASRVPRACATRSSAARSSCARTSTPDPLGAAPPDIVPLGS